MKHVSLTVMMLSLIFLCGQTQALTLVQDGLLTEWVGGEINTLGTEPAPEGGTYTLLATWDGTNLYLGVDRDSSDRYLGDTGWDNDSFFVAIDTDGIAGAGADWDGYTRMQFNGPMKPDVIYYFAGGGPGWHERGVWNGLDWDWIGWTDAGQYYGHQEANPNDELAPDLVVQVPGISGASELHVWAWMTREGNGFVEASWPRGASGYVQQIFGDPITIRDEVTRLFMPHDQSPALYEAAVDGDAPVTVSWQVAQDSVGIIDPTVAAYKVYVSSALPLDPNLIGPAPSLTWVTDVPKASWVGTEASANLGFALDKDARYVWRVDTVLNDTSEITGDLWTFYTELTTPQITSDPEYQVVDAGSTALFSVTVDSASTPTYAWYKYVDGISDALLTTGGDISGADTATLSIADAQIADEGTYYCVVGNDSPVTDTSAQALLGIKRRIAYWDFESGNANSTVAGSPASMLYNDPAFAVAGGIAGDGMEFDNDPNSEDILYTDPDQVSYFDICNYSMTVACWVKSSFAASWGPLVARNGESFEPTDGGWQLRHNGTTLDRVSFTTRGTGNDDGRASNVGVYDGQWHYVVATYDGIEKKVYIDGVAQRLYSSEDGSFINDAEAVSGPMNPTPSPVSLAGRVKGESGDLVFEGNSVTPCVLDEVAIYNYALDAATVAQNYADMTATTVCAGIQPYDLDGDCKVNLNEVSLIASEWLSDITVQPTP